MWCLPSTELCPQNVWCPDAPGGNNCGKAILTKLSLSIFSSSRVLVPDFSTFTLNNPTIYCTSAASLKPASSKPFVLWPPLMHVDTSWYFLFPTCGIQNNPPTPAKQRGARQGIGVLTPQQRGKPHHNNHKNDKKAQFWSFDTVQEQDQQTNQPTGPASKTSKQKQQARPAFWLLYRTKFRRYVGQFLGALLPLLNPSLPWGFAAGSDSSFGAAAVLDRDQQANQPAGQLARPDNKSSVFLFSGVGGRSGIYTYIHMYVANESFSCHTKLGSSQIDLCVHRSLGIEPSPIGNEGFAHL